MSIRKIIGWLYSSEDPEHKGEEIHYYPLDSEHEVDTLYVEIADMHIALRGKEPWITKLLFYLLQQVEVADVY